jgi:phage terminase small subunit
MARPRKPTAVLELSGAFKKDPQRKRTNEPRPATKVGQPPPWLDDDEAEIWERMSREGFWLTSADEFLLEVAVRYQRYFRNGGTDTKAISLLVSVLNKLGFGPAERSKIKAPGSDEEEKPFC